MQTYKLSKLEGKTVKDVNKTFCIYSAYQYTKDGEIKIGYKETPREITNIFNLQKYISQKADVKALRDMIGINPHVNNTKVNKDALLPNTVMVDIDIKHITKDFPKNSIDNQTTANNLFIKDMGCSNLDEASDKLLEQFKQDPYCYYCDKSNSGTGIKALFMVFSKHYDGEFFESQSQVMDEYYDRYNRLTEKQKEMQSGYLEELFIKTTDSAEIQLTMAKRLHHHNHDALMQYLSKYNIKIHDVEADYIDTAGRRLNQNTYSSSGNSCYINPNAKILFWDFESDEEEENFKDISNINVSSTTFDDDKNKRIELNNSYLREFYRHVRLLKIKHDLGSEKATKKLMKIGAKLKKKLKNFDTGKALYNALNESDIRAIHIFYKQFVKNLYRGSGSINTSTFDTYIHTTQCINMKKKILLAEQLKSLYYSKSVMADIKKYTSLNVLKHQENADFFNNKYDVTLKYDGYVSKRKKEIFEIFDNNLNIVMKADAGGGKSTLLQEYIHKCFKGGMSRIVFCIPKNSLLQQLQNIIQRDYPQYTICENYGNKHYNKSDYMENEKVIIMSSTKKLKFANDADLYVIDEIQNLVMYSNAIISNRNKDAKTIFISATPEAYLIYESDYYYMNLERDTKVKKDLNMIITSDVNNSLKRLVDKDRKQLVFYNNIEMAKAAADSLDVEFEFINSSIKDEEHVVKVLKEQELEGDHYMCTSYVSDGINFNNTEWNDLIIVESDTLSIFEIYQLSNRFRKLNDLNVYLISIPRSQECGKEIKFNNFKKDEHYQLQFDSFSKKCDQINSLPKSFDKSEYVDSKYIIKDTDDTYVFNEDSLKKDAYEDHFNINYQAYSDVHYASLHYYFNVNLEYWKFDKKIKFEANAVLEEIFFKYTDAIVDIITTQNNFRNHVEQSDDELFGSAAVDDYDNLFTNADLKLILENISYFKKLVSRYNELKILNGDMNKVTAKQGAYTNHVKNIRHKRLGDCENPDKLKGMSLLAWERQNRMIQIIRDNDFTYPEQKHNKDTVTAVDFPAVVNFFTKNVTVYDEFRDANNIPEFKIDKQSIAAYVNHISRSVSRTSKSSTVNDNEGNKRRTTNRYTCVKHLRDIICRCPSSPIVKIKDQNLLYMYDNSIHELINEIRNKSCFLF